MGLADTCWRLEGALQAFAVSHSEHAGHYWLLLVMGILVELGDLQLAAINIDDDKALAERFLSLTAQVERVCES
jgi:hypothetical protein